VRTLLARRRRVHDEDAVVGPLRTAAPGALPRGRTRPGDVLALDLPHLDLATADRLLRLRPAAVLLAGPAVSWRYPHRGPERLLDAGVVLVDRLGPRLLDAVRPGTTVQVLDGRVLVGEGRDRWVETQPVLQGLPQDHDSVAAALEESARGMVTRLEAFAEGTSAVMVAERDLLLEGVGVPEVPVELAGRTVVVCVRGYGWAEDLRALRRFIADTRPVLVGVAGGADALLEQGLTPDLVVVESGTHRGADPDTDAWADTVDELDGVDDGGPTQPYEGEPDEASAVTRAALACGAHVVVRCPPGEPVVDGRPGTESRFPSGLTTEDTAILLAHARGAATVVTVGSHATLEEFLDRGRAGSASSFLTRLRAGSTVVDAATVARLHRPRRSWAVWVLLVLALLTAALSVTAATPWGQEQLVLLGEAGRTWPATDGLGSWFEGLRAG
jgi:uncharacterized membrane-anchored protein